MARRSVWWWVSRAPAEDAGRGRSRPADDLVQAAEGWQFLLESSINDAGQIAGTGELDGHHHGYLPALR